MTNEEFATWIKRLYVCLPSYRRWFSQLGATELDTQRLWRDALRDYSLEECVSVVERWVTGELPAPEAYSRDVTPGLIKNYIDQERAASSRLATEAREAELAAQRNGIGEYHKPSSRDDYRPIAPVLAKALALAKKGMPPDQVAKQIHRELPASRFEGPRHHCGTCCDRGMVEVWRMDVARAVDRGELELNQARGSYMVACSCEAGDLLAKGHERWKPMPRYDEQQFCVYRNDPIDQERSRLHDWLNERFEAKKLPEFVHFE